MDNRTRAQEWQKFAEMDLKSGEYLLNMHPVPMEIICYHCQQSAEKYLKGYLVCSITPLRRKKVKIEFADLLRNQQIFLFL